MKQLINQSANSQQLPVFLHS